MPSTNPLVRLSSSCYGNQAPSCRAAGVCASPLLKVLSSASSAGCLLNHGRLVVCREGRGEGMESAPKPGANSMLPPMRPCQESAGRTVLAMQLRHEARPYPSCPLQVPSCCPACVAPFHLRDQVRMKPMVSAPLWISATCELWRWRLLTWRLRPHHRHPWTGSCGIGGS